MLDLLELCVILLQPVMDVSCFHRNELRVLVLSIVDALLAAEISPLVIEGHKRQAPVLLARDLVVDDLCSLLDEDVCQLFGYTALPVEAI